MLKSWPCNTCWPCLGSAFLCPVAHAMCALPYFPPACPMVNLIPPVLLDYGRHIRSPPAGAQQAPARPPKPPGAPSPLWCAMVPPSRSTAATIQALQVGQPTIVTYRKWVQGRGKHNIQVYHSIQVQGRGKHNGIQTMGRHVWCSTNRMYVVLSPVPQAPYGAPSSLWCPKLPMVPQAPYGAPRCMYVVANMVQACSPLWCRWVAVITTDAKSKTRLHRGGTCPTMAVDSTA